MTFEKWLHRLIEEKQLDTGRVFKIDTAYNLHFVEFGVVIDFILSMPMQQRDQCRTQLVKVDFNNGDVMHFFEYVAQFVAEETDRQSV